MDDLIKRADVVEMLWKIGFDDDPEALIKATLEMPSAKAVPENIEETFERMAFEAGEERDLLKYVFTHHFEPCDVCVYRNRECDCENDCDVCGEINCPCKNCWISGSNENFVLDAEFVKEKIRKEKENG